MSLQAERLSSLIEFCHQSARLRGKPTASVSAHAGFSLYEGDLQGVPGVRLNSNGLDGEELWLSVDRLHETNPPEVTNEWLIPWIIIHKGPNEQPSLKESVIGSNLLSVGTHVTYDVESEAPKVSPDDHVPLEEYAEAAKVQSLLHEYVSSKWTAWAVEEKKRLKTIRLYSQLFTLKQQLEGGIVEAQLELVWGVGLGVWKTSSTTVNYPLIGQLVELALNPATAALEVRPREVDTRVELDWYAAQDNLGVADLEKSGKNFFEELETTFSPFDRATFEPLLQTAVTHLDANGVYWPSQVPAEDRTVPKAEAQLRITDTWVLFSRPRTNSAYLQDLERLRAHAENLEELPPAVAAIVTDPATDNPEVTMPPFRGVSASYHSGSEGTSGTSASKTKDLYFPKPFNDEQVRIIQLLEVFDGVVAQGPPGTGKTHTIANVICHYLANGKRVLVTSMKDPALAVLQDQLPEEIRPLAISLLTSEQEGLKKFEHSILKIASEVQSIDRGLTAREINHLEQTIDALHSQLSRIDWDISSWAKKNLTNITINSTEISPHDAAHELVENLGQFEWIPDDLNITEEFEPKFSDTDISGLRESRRELAEDIDYLYKSLPQLIEFPDSKVVLETHQDLAKFEQLKNEIEIGDVPALADTTQTSIDAAIELQVKVDEIKLVRTELETLNQAWTTSIHSQLAKSEEQDVIELLKSLGQELEEVNQLRKDFLKKPVSTVEGTESNKEVTEAIDNLCLGNRPFGITGIFGKSEEKKILETIKVLGNAPSQIEDWKHVASYLAIQRRQKELAFRWNALSTELNLPAVEATPNGGSSAHNYFLIFTKIEQLVAVEKNALIASINLFPSWTNASNVIRDSQRFIELDKALRHHLTKNRLSNVWIQKERFQKILDGRSGRVISEINLFLNQTLGNSTVSDSQMQGQWSDLMAELSRVLGLKSKLEIVDKVTTLIEQSGAIKFANMLKQPAAPNIDDLLPTNWRSAWKLKRISTYLTEIDAQSELKNLANKRRVVESELARAYKEVVVKRTWLKLAENASPSIRAALQAYLSAIQKIGKGTGKRAVRYRQDARNAATQANSAVPCWIMPHYRVSESLPSEIGCFDLVIVDEASQSDLTALPALLRAKKVLIVGDDKQVSPEGVGLEEEKIRNLMTRFLGLQVDTYKPQMSPERSIYDLFKVVYANSLVMLKEHFRCVGPIIEYSKREFYNHELRPLRLPKASERLDPPLIDIIIQDGYRNGDRNLPEARYIVDEIKRIVSDETLANRSIGVVSLLGDKQAFAVWELLTEELGPELLQRHRIACGDARTFQGKERDIMFLSMVVAPNEQRIMPLSRDTYLQRFNVAASRARDRMYLVRSVLPEHLSDADKLRRGLISHFSAPFAQDEARVEDFKKLCESPFEIEVYEELTKRGFWVTPQVRVGHFRIDMVVEGKNDARLAIECDGDKYHGPDKWADDMHRQRILERAGWVFWRCFASAFVRRREEVLADLLKTLIEHGIEPVGSEFTPKSIHTEQRLITTSDLIKAAEEAPPETQEIHDGQQANEEIKSIVAEPGLIETSALTDKKKVDARPEQTPNFVPRGWIEHLIQKKPELKDTLQVSNIWDEESYEQNENRLDGELRLALALERYELIAGAVPSQTGILSNLRACPQWFLKERLENLDLSVRVRNVCNANNLLTIEDLAIRGYLGLLRLPNLGQHSLNTLGKVLSDAFKSGQAINGKWWNERADKPPSSNSSLEIQEFDTWDSGTKAPFFSEPFFVENYANGISKAAQTLTLHERELWFSRIGFQCPQETLQQLGEKTGISRERIRQIEKKIYRKLADHPFWDFFSTRIEARLADTAIPLFINDLGSIDPWFSGIDLQAISLEEIFNHLYKDRYSIFQIEGKLAITRLHLQSWELAIEEGKNLLQEMASKHVSESHSRFLIQELIGDEASELRGAFWLHVSSFGIWAQGEANEKFLCGVGRTAESIVLAVLTHAKQPLHYEEIHRRATLFSGKPHELRALHHAAGNVAVLYNRGTYGLASQCPLSEEELSVVRSEIENIADEADANKQWHTSELLDELLDRGFDFNGRLTKYIINIALSKSEYFVSLRRMIWGLKDKWDASASLRIDIRDSIVELLQNAGHPLTTTEIRNSLKANRGLNNHFQIFPTGKLIRVGTGLWGLVDRDVKVKNPAEVIERIKNRAISTSEGIHISELPTLLPDVSSEGIDSILGIISTHGLKKDKGQYVYPSDWSTSRRLLPSTSIEKAMQDHKDGATFDQIFEQVQNLTKRKLERDYVSHLLASLDLAKFDAEKSLWILQNKSEKFDD